MPIILGVIATIALVFSMTFLGYESYKFFAPRFTAVDNAVFHESAQYNDGMIRDFENLELQYKQTKDENERAALKATILHRFSIYPIEKLPPSLLSFYENLRTE